MSLAVQMALNSLFHNLAAATKKALSKASFLDLGISSMIVEDGRDDIAAGLDLTWMLSMMYSLENVTESLKSDSLVDR